MSIKLMSAIWPIEMASTQKFVLITLADQANDEGVCWPSAETVAKRTGLSERAVRYAIHALVKAGHLSTEARPGRSMVFTVHPEPRHVVHPGTSCTPAPDAPHPGTSCRTPRHVVPDTPARGAPITIKNPKGTQKEPKEEVPDWVPEREWVAFVEMRKTGRGVFTGHAQELAVRKLDDLRRQGYPPAEVLNQSTMNGWKGLFPLKADGAGNGKHRTEKFSPSQWIADQLAGRVDDTAPREVSGDVWDALPEPVRRS